MGTSLHLCADKKCAGDESLPTATPRESPLGARRVFVEQEPTEQTEESPRVIVPSAVPLPLAESENAIIPAKRSASCNSILKTRSRRIAQATVLSDLEAGKRRAK